MPPEITDDEDSDEQLLREELARARNRRSENRRLRKNSESFGYESHDSDAMNRIQKMKEKSKLIRERRSGSLSHWPVAPTKLDSENENERQATKKLEKMSLASPVMSRKIITSDSMTSDLEPDIKQAQEEKPSKIAPIVVKNVPVKLTPKQSPKVECDQDSEEQEPPKTTRPVTKTPLKVSDQDYSKVASTSARPAESLKKQTLSKSSTPPPPTAELKKDWECEHCTFVNEYSAKICGVCCKTPAVRLKTLPGDEADIDIPESLLNQDNQEDQDDEAKKKGRTKKISFLPGTKAH